MENNEINLESLNVEEINNLIGDASVIKTETIPTDSGIVSGMSISMDREVIPNKVDEKLTYNLHIPADVVSYALDESGNQTNQIVIDPEFVKEYFKAEELFNSLKNQLEDAKIAIKMFIENNDTGSITSNGMEVKYSPATTTTTLDSAKLKAKYPDIAAEFSKVSPRKSSISIKEIKED